jgi:hypothetical protein
MTGRSGQLQIPCGIHLPRLTIQCCNPTFTQDASASRQAMCADRRHNDPMVPSTPLGVRLSRTLPLSHRPLPRCLCHHTVRTKRSSSRKPQADGLQAGHGRGQDVATIERTKSVAQTPRRCQVPGRNRGRRDEAAERRLIGLVTQIPT